MTDGLVVVAILGFLGQSLAVLLSAYLASRSAKSSAAAQLGVEMARADAGRAAANAADAARALVESAVVTGAKIDKLALVGDATHKIVNSQRTVMLRLVAALTRRIANENPSDPAAQDAAIHAEFDLHQAELANASAE